MTKTGIITTGPLVAETLDVQPRDHLCTITSWCVLRVEHGGPCLEVRRAEHDPPDFGPRRAVKR